MHVEGLAVYSGAVVAVPSAGSEAYFLFKQRDKHSLILLVIACSKLCKKGAALITNQSINNK